MTQTAYMVTISCFKEPKMSKLSLLAVLFITGVLAIAPAKADAPNYQLQTQADGTIVRLNVETGAISTCEAKEGGELVCRLSADERTALEAEIDKLAAENKVLADQLAAKTTELDDWRAKLPSQEQVDGAMRQMGIAARELEERLRNISRSLTEPKPE
jgi:hypothetical protein